MNPIPVPEIVKAARPWCRVVDMGRPAGVPEAECGSAEMLIQASGSRPLTGFSGRSQYAYFKPTPDELELLNAGGFLEMCQIGTVVQPFSLAVWPGEVSAEPVEDFSGLPRAKGECDCGRCQAAGRGLYWMLGACINCLAKPILMSFREGDPTSRCRCPLCHVDAVLVTRRLTDAETALLATPTAGE